MLFADTETTGLTLPSASSIDKQPEIIEICIIKTDDEFNKVDELSTFVRSKKKVPEEITRITGINDAMLEGAPTFVEIYPRLCELFLGETDFIAHNCKFDLALIYFELTRIDRTFHFPWPVNWVCTMEQTKHIKNKFLRLTHLHELATGKPHDDKAHRAKNDVHALIRCYHWMKQEGIA